MADLSLLAPASAPKQPVLRGVQLTGVQPPALPSFAEIEAARLSEPAIRLIVDAAVNADALGRVLDVLRR